MHATVHAPARAAKPVVAPHAAKTKTTATTKTATTREYEYGMRPALHYLALAWIALYIPIKRVIDRVPMRVYATACAGMYGGAALLLLSVSGTPHLTVTQTSAGFLASGIAVALWALGALAVAILQAVSVFALDGRTWRIASIATAMYAGAWDTVVILAAIFYGGDWGRPLFWTWALVVHLLFIRNRLVPDTALANERELLAWRAQLDELRARRAESVERERDDSDSDGASD